MKTLKSNQQIGGAVLVAGFTSKLGYEELSSFFTKPIGWKKIKAGCRKFIAIHSDNDSYVSPHYGEFFKKNLDAELIIEQKMKHFSGDDGINELPVALESVLKLAK